MGTTTIHLLVPVDYSDISVYGLKYAAKLVKATNGKITAINVIKGVDPIWSDMFSDVEREILLNRLKDYMHKFVLSHIDISDEALDCQIVGGTMCDTIMKLATQLQADAIVMGTSQADNIKKRIIGSNALRIMAEAKCPVITVKRTPTDADIKRIILPIDISKDGREKAVDAVRLADILHAEILVVSAYTINDDLILRKLKQYQEQVVSYITGHGIKCSGQLLAVDNQVDGVLNFIDEQKGDIVVITTHEQLKIVSSFLGSFAKSMVSKSKVPVMSIVPRNKYKVIFDLPGCS